MRCLMFPLILLILAACSGEAPDIIQTQHRLLMYKDTETGQVVERLSVFLLPDDPDGADDLESLHLIHDEAELYWKLDVEMWDSMDYLNAPWVGSNGFISATGGPLPRGEYRILLRDFSGESVTAKLRLDAPVIDKPEFPRLRFDDDRIYVVNPPAGTQIWIYDGDVRFLKAFPADEDGLSVSAVRASTKGLPQSFPVYVYYPDSEWEIGYLAGPYDSPIP